MTYSRYQQLKPSDLRRLCGVHHQPFVRMVAVLKEQVEQIKLKQGLPSKLSVEDQVSNELGILAGVPNVLPYRASLGSA